MQRFSYAIIIVSAFTLFLWSGCRENGTNTAISSDNKNLKVSYNDQIKPILSDRCYPCHGPDENTRKGDLRLDTQAGLLQTSLSEGGVPVVPFQPDSSALIQRVFHEDPDEFMPPPESKILLTSGEKSLLRQWILEGAQIEPHWSFMPIIKPPIPTIHDTSWVTNEVDYFVLTKLEEQQLSPSLPAQPEILLRRLFLDLIGLPPTLTEVESYLQTPDYEHWVDRLLMRSAFGEKWCWMWLDKARYADSNGFQADPERTMWPWRDWVIKAFNENMPFDRFTIEQLAGDLLPNPSLDNILASGFNRNHMYNGEGGRIPEETRVENVFDRVETVGTVWMGLTLNCARCHDHKFDPVSQLEYYELFDFFNQTSESGQNSNGMVEPTLDLSDYLYEQETKSIKQSILEIIDSISWAELKIDHSKIVDVSLLELLKIPLELRNEDQLNSLFELLGDQLPGYRRLGKNLFRAREKLAATTKDRVKVMVMDEVKSPRATTILAKGVYNQPREKVSGNVPEFLPPMAKTDVPNRYTFAKWLVDSKHPLTSRVIVNQFWQEIFGHGLVHTPADFGNQGDKPTHPELLDWLAAFFQDHWDMKKLIKTIVMSSTYRQSSKSSEIHHKNDPQNELLARGPRFRMPSWMIRDQALAVSGLLVSKLGGPPVYPYQPKGIWEEATFGLKKYPQDQGENLYRRTLYIFWRRIVGPTMLFDNAARQVCEVTPLRTNTPLHALVTLNDVAYVEAARVMAQRLLQEGISTSEMLEKAFNQTVIRKPNSFEMEILDNSWQKWHKHFATYPEGAVAYISVGNFPNNHKLDPINLATMTAVCSVILNLDETLTKQ